MLLGPQARTPNYAFHRRSTDCSAASLRAPSNFVASSRASIVASRYHHSSSQLSRLFILVAEVEILSLALVRVVRGICRGMTAMS